MPSRARRSLEWDQQQPTAQMAPTVEAPLPHIEVTDSKGNDVMPSGPSPANSWSSASGHRDASEAGMSGRSGRLSPMMDMQALTRGSCRDSSQPRRCWRPQPIRFRCRVALRRLCQVERRAAGGRRTPQGHAHIYHDRPLVAGTKALDRSSSVPSAGLMRVVISIS